MGRMTAVGCGCSETLVSHSADPRPIGVFDSGVGGLTVLAALERALPHESFIYLGDTARLPYGTKTPASVERYALQCAAALVEGGVKALVVACNTASSAALPALRRTHPQLPVVGVIEPGATQAVEATRNRRVAVLATEGTVRAGAYQTAIADRDPAIVVTAIGCSVFVALAEEGWGDSDIARLAAARYLGDTFRADDAPDTLLLGCTHFPLLRRALEATVPSSVAIVDSAETTARAVATQLATSGQIVTTRGTTRFWATDGPERFARVGGLFLGRVLSAEKIERVDV
jgi:glutamate racemase